MQRQVRTFTERKDAYNMQVSQDWKTFRWSRTMLLSDPAANFDQDESSRVLRFYIVCWSLKSISIQQLDNKLDDVWKEHGFAEHLKFTAQEVQFIWHVLPCASTLDIQKHIQTYLNGRNPESFEDWAHIHVDVERR